MGKFFGDYHESTLEEHGDCHIRYYGLTSDKLVVLTSSASARESTPVYKSNFISLQCSAHRLGKKVAEKRM